MTRQRRIMPGLLVIAVLVSILGSLLYAGVDRLRTIRREGELLRAQYEKLLGGALGDQPDREQKVQALKLALDAELGRYYEKDEIDLYRFASTVSSTLARYGVTVEQFRTIGSGRSQALEVKVRAAPSSFMAFLAEASSSSKYWTIPYLHVQAQTASGTLTGEFQIGYLVHDDPK